MTPESDYVQIKSHYVGDQRHWVHVRHRTNDTDHVYHIRCHKLSDYVPGLFQVCTTCNVRLIEEPTPVAKSYEPEHHCPGCRCWENVR